MRHIKLLRSATVFGFCAFALAALAEDTPKYTDEEAAKHIGETATVTGKVADAFQPKGGGHMFLNMGGRHPKETFTVFISGNNASAFADLKSYQGKTVSVTGKIIDHNGKPEIIVKAPADITIKEESAATAEAPAATAAGSPSPAASASASP